MRRLLDLVSTLAVGFFVATVIGVTTLEHLPFGKDGLGLGRIDYASLGLGLILGVLISTVARVGWSEIPRRVVSYLVARRGTFQLMAWGVAFAVVLVLY